MILLHTFAIIKVKENYDGIAEGHEECFNSINEMLKTPEVVVEGKKYDLEFFLCCDYKVSSYIAS